MEDHQEGWPVGQLELLAAEAALRDTDYERRTLSAFKEDLPAFRTELEALGLAPLPSQAPFILAPVASGIALAQRLAQEAILVRTCAQWPGLGDGYIRLALRSAPDRRRLLEALRGAI